MLPASLGQIVRYSFQSRYPHFERLFNAQYVAAIVNSAILMSCSETFHWAVWTLSLGATALEWTGLKKFPVVSF